MQSSQPQRILAANFACMAAMAFWAVGFPAGEILLESWGTVLLIVIRLVLSIPLLLLFWYLCDGYSAIKSAPWLQAIGIGGASFGLGAVLLLFGQKLSDPVTPAIAAAMMPIAGAVLEVFLDGRRLRLNLVAGILLALGGGFLATGVRLSEGAFGIGAFVCLISVCLFAWGTRATTRNLQGLSPIGQTTSTLIGGLCFNLVVLTIFLIFGIEGAEVGTLAGNNFFYLLVFAISSLAIAQFLWIWGAGQMGILLASFHMNVVPFYVMVFLVIFFGGIWDWNQAFGAALVASGVVIAQVFQPARSDVQHRRVEAPKPAIRNARTFQPFMWMGS
ncbi:MAG: DMT family transporter [Pseudomonadota bacterium]